MRLPRRQSSTASSRMRSPPPKAAKRTWLTGVHIDLGAQATARRVRLQGHSLLSVLLVVITSESPVSAFAMTPHKLELSGMARRRLWL